MKLRLESKADNIILHVSLIVKAILNTYFKTLQFTNSDIACNNIFDFYLNQLIYLL